MRTLLHTSFRSAERKLMELGGVVGGIKRKLIEERWEGLRSKVVEEARAAGMSARRRMT